MTDTRIWPVLLSGGVGARLWPVSRRALPKQLLALTDAATMLQATAARVADPARFRAPIVVASAGHQIAVAEQLTAAGCPPAALILEPVARNTAPAIALAALEISRDDPQGLMLVMPSDHRIAAPAALQLAVDAARPLAAAGWLVTFGITPDAPATGYGYIELGEPLAPGVRRVARFVEKPDLATAQAWLAGGRHVWNGGIFLMRADTLLEALALHAPAIDAACRAAFDKAGRVGQIVTPDAPLFATCPAVSIDYAVFEPATRVAVAPVDMGWSDIGSWDALRAIGPGDAQGNTVQGNVIALSTRNCLLRAEGPILATIGVQDLIIVATEDAVLVSAAGASQDVKACVDALAGNPALDLPRREVHPWGSLRRLVESDHVDVVEVTLRAGAAFPSADARMTVIAGSVWIDGREFGSGDSQGIDNGSSIVAAAGARLLLVKSRC